MSCGQRTWLLVTNKVRVLFPVPVLRQWWNIDRCLAASRVRGEGNLPNVN